MQLAARRDFEYLRPPVEPYGVLQWTKADELIRLGLDHAAPKAARWGAEKVRSALNIDAQAFPCLQHNDKEATPSDAPYCTARSPTSDWARVSMFPTLDLDPPLSP